VVRRLLAAAVAVLVLAGCGSTVPTAERGAGSRAFSSEQEALDGATDVSGPDAIDGGPTAATPDASARRTAAGGTASGAAGQQGGGPTSGAPNRSPIELGILYTVNDGAQSAGIDNGNTFSLSRAVRAFVDAYNDAGGIAGRRIVPVYAEMHSASNNYEAQVEAACATFTQDHKVAAVITNVGYYSPILLACTQKASVPIFAGDYAGPDESDAARFPLFVTPVTPVGEARVEAVIEHLAGAGFLTRANKVGVIIEDCPINQRVHQRAVVPALREAGLTLAATYAPRCFLSLADYGGQATDTQAAVLQFRQAGVDRVLFVSQAAEANIMNLFSTGAEAQGYRPGYALSSVAIAVVLAANAPAAQLANAKGVGWLPVLDSANTSQEPTTATARRCLDMVKKEGVNPASPADTFFVYGPCDSFELFAAVLRATNGDASAAAVTRALPGVGGSYVAASTVGGRVGVRNGRVGPGAARLFGWVNGRFEYTSAAFAL
jgi:ABC-type branched-subunit amino acid transport system substrate-binding protein